MMKIVEQFRPWQKDPSFDVGMHDIIIFMILDFYHVFMTFYYIKGERDIESDIKLPHFSSFFADRNMILYFRCIIFCLFPPLFY